MDGGRTHAYAIHCRNVIGMKTFLILYSPNKITLEGVVHNYCLLRTVQAINFLNVFQLLILFSISTSIWT